MTEHATRSTPSYRGRIAPSPTGYLHLGHARTFWVAQQRALERGGVVILRNEDLDGDRCKPVFVEAMFEDLRWFGLQWTEGPDRGGPFTPYNQSGRMPFYRELLNRLIASAAVYPCTCSRKDIQSAVTAPHAADDEVIYPGTCRVGLGCRLPVAGCKLAEPETWNLKQGTKFSWRFRVPDGEVVTFEDGNLGPQQFEAGKDFGDFVVWRHDDVPAYQLACVADDAAMQITEVVRGADLLVSTARQLLLYRALGLPAPAFFHCALMTDESGERLAKRHDALSLRQLRAQGRAPEEIRARWFG
jgi:glutamyl/glutaminyl-tRNA synthetase